MKIKVPRIDPYGKPQKISNKPGFFIFDSLKLYTIIQFFVSKAVFKPI